MEPASGCRIVTIDFWFSLFPQSTTHGDAAAHLSREERRFLSRALRASAKAVFLDTRLYGAFPEKLIHLLPFYDAALEQGRPCSRCLFRVVHQTALYRPT